MRDALKVKVISAPDAPGVYLMKDKSGKIIYIGKAKSLKKRLKSYFAAGLIAQRRILARPLAPGMSKTAALVSNIFDIEFKPCPTEAISLLLEASLIRKYKPKYNVSLRDDKNFPLVMFSGGDYPALFIARRKDCAGARYFGPYTSAKLLKQALKIIRREFPFRSCKALPKKACLYLRLKLCPGPCVKGISKKAYAKTINSIVMILEGRISVLTQRLAKEMALESKAFNFEAAAQIRDQINALSAITSSQSGFSSHDALEDLKSLLKLNKTPKRIEAFDVSNLSGQEAVGSMVSFFMAQPDKNNYRRFRIKTVDRIDDYAMISEVVLRRYQRLVSENKTLPDLILIDGGREHFIAARRQLESLDLEIPLASIAKEEEHIYFGGKVRFLKLKSDTPALNLIRRVRDEAHRFALAYHHLLRRKKLLQDA